MREGGEFHPGGCALQLRQRASRPWVHGRHPRRRRGQASTGAGCRPAGRGRAEWQPAAGAQMGKPGRAVPFARQHQARLGQRRRRRQALRIRHRQAAQQRTVCPRLNATRPCADGAREGAAAGLFPGPALPRRGPGADAVQHRRRTSARGTFRRTGAPARRPATAGAALRTGGARQSVIVRANGRGARPPTRHGAARCRLWPPGWR